MQPACACSRGSPGAGPRWDAHVLAPKAYQEQALDEEGLFCCVEEIAMMQPDDALAPPPKEAGALRVQIRVKQHA
ncbi:MAG: hypothetical protein ACK55Z_01220, partial [bacterium]